MRKLRQVLNQALTSKAVHKVALKTAATTSKAQLRMWTSKR
jgi:hypothetical protein